MTKSDSIWKTKNRYLTPTKKVFLLLGGGGNSSYSTTINNGTSENFQSTLDP